MPFPFDLADGEGDDGFAFLPVDDGLVDEEEDKRFAAIRQREALARRPWREEGSPVCGVRGLREATAGPAGAVSLPMASCGRVLFREADGAHGGDIISTGSKVWDSALVMVKYIDALVTSCTQVQGALPASPSSASASAAAAAAGPAAPHVLAGARVIELGAGLGLPGLAAARCGAAETVLTDVPARLELLTANAELNRGDESAVAGRECGPIAVRSLDWRALEEARRSLGAFDVVLCTDLLFSDQATPLLVDVIDALTDVGSLVLNCCEHRWPGAADFYELMVARGFHVAAVPPAQQHPEYQHGSIHLHRFVRAAKG